MLFTFRTPPKDRDAKAWSCALFSGFDIGSAPGSSGMTVLAPTAT